MPRSWKTCPVCGTEHTDDSRKAKNGSGGRPVVCPYDGLAYGQLRAAHDRIYFGPWRRMDASPMDIQRAYQHLGRYLRSLGRALETKDLPAARRDLEKAFEAYADGDPQENRPDTLRFMDHALSYAHRVVDDLLHEEGLPPHAPMDFAPWYDAGEVPFREDW